MKYVKLSVELNTKFFVFLNMEIYLPVLKRGTAFPLISERALIKFETVRCGANLGEAPISKLGK